MTYAWYPVIALLALAAATFAAHSVLKIIDAMSEPDRDPDE